MAKGGKRKWIIDDFVGGLSRGSKRGIKGSFRGGVGLDYRSDPDTLSANRKLTKNSGSTVDELIKWFEEVDTDVWGLGNSGTLFKRTTGGTWSEEHATGGSGQGLALFRDYLYYATSTGIGRYGPLSGTPAYDDDFLASESDNIQSWNANVGNTYTLPTSITEGATHQEDFTATQSSLTGVFFAIAAKGTGNVTVTVHLDADDSVIASTTVATADITNGLQLFVFDGAPTLVVGTAYHFHITVSTGTTTVTTGTSSDLNTSRHAVLAYFLPEDVDQSYDYLTSTQSNMTAYAAASSVLETATQRQTFTPERNTQIGLSLFFITTGSGDVTVTIHDSLNRVMDTATITQANLKAGGWLKFPVSWRANVGEEYHFHVTVTTGTTNIATSTTTDLEDAAFRTHYQILETDSDYHPMLFFPGAISLVVGNGNYLAKYDGIIYREAGAGTGNERLKFADHEKVRCLAMVGDHLAIGTWRGDGIEDHGSSRIYFWDGSAPEAIGFKDVLGEVNAMLTGNDGLLYVWHGGFGHISVFDGDMNLLHTVPLVGENKFVEIFPGGVTNWRGLPHFATGDGDSTANIRGVYEFGSVSKDYPRSLNYAYVASTGTVNNNIRYGAIKGVGPALFMVAWENTAAGPTVTYGVDIVDVTADQASVTYETLIFDAGQVFEEKKSSSITLNFIALESGDTITLKYKLDRASSWTTLDTASFTTDGAVVQKSFPFDKRWNELELQVTLATTGAGAPELSGIVTYFNFEGDEQK